MPVGQPTSSTPTYLGRVITCDPTQRIVEVVLNASGQRLQIMTTPVCARWPMVGETWTVCFVNNTPYLGEPYQTYQAGLSSLRTGIEEIPPGDAWINSPTGVVHVLGSADGSTDFTFNSTTYVKRGSAAFAASNGPMTAATGTSTTITALTTLPSLSITLSKAARVRLSGSMTAYTTIASSAVSFYYQVDSGSYVFLDHFLFNIANQHLKVAAFVFPTATLSAGTHIISWGYVVGSGSNVVMDINDSYCVMAEEMFA